MICIILVKKKSGSSNKPGIRFQRPRILKSNEVSRKKIDSLFMIQLKAAANKRLCVSGADGG